MKAEVTSATEPVPRQKFSFSTKVLSVGAWLAAFSVLAFAVYLGWQVYTRPKAKVAAVVHEPPPMVQETKGNLTSAPEVVPAFEMAQDVLAIPRRLALHTIIPGRSPSDVREYTVQFGDSVFEIAAQFHIRPETVLWGNYELLNDNPDLISVGMKLLIPPVDGVLYQWQEGDTLESVAAMFDANPADILNWPGNGLDLTNPQIEPGTLILVVGGHREFRQWLIPTIPRGSAGVSRSVYGDGVCEGSYEGAYGTGTFVWPTNTHSLSGNDYWDGHLGIDIAAGEGAPIFAADSGVVVFSGWANGGYGMTVIIDHGNGYQTLYAHLSKIVVGCGRSVLQGGTIAYAGSTGNSTGPHLHFEVRYLGGFISPWFVLPAP